MVTTKSFLYSSSLYVVVMVDDSLVGRVKSSLGGMWDSSKESARQLGLKGSLYLGLSAAVLGSGCRDEPVGPEPVYPSSAVWDLPVQVFNGGMGGRDGVLEGRVLVENPGGFQGDLRVWSVESGFEKVVGVGGLSSLEVLISDTLRFPGDELPMDVSYSVGVLSSGGVWFEDSHGVRVVDPGKVDAILGWSGAETVFSRGFWNTGVYEFSVNASSLDTVKVLSVRLGDKEWLLEPDRVSFDTTLSKIFSVDSPVQKGLYVGSVDGRGFVTERVFGGVFVDVLPVHGVEVVMRKYLSQEPNVGGSVSFRNMGVGWDTVFVADGGGVVRGVLPEGVYDVLVDGRGYKNGGSGGSHLSRLKVSEDVLSGVGFGFVLSGPGLDSDGFLQYHPGWGIDPTLIGWGLSGPLMATASNFSLEESVRDLWVRGVRVEGGVSLLVESVDCELFLEKMARFASPYGLVVPRVGVPLYVVVNLGNHDYPDSWSPWDHIWDPDLPLPDGGLNPPGVVSPLYDHRRFTEVAFDVYWEEHVLPIVNEGLVGGNPFDFRVKKGYADEVKEYLDSWSWLAFGDNLLYFASSHPVGAVESARLDFDVVQEGGRSRRVWFVNTSNVIVPWRDMDQSQGPRPNVRSLGSEDTFHGAVRQGYPPVQSDGLCSTRNEYRWGIVNTCDILPESVLHDFDRDFRRVAYGFGPAGQVQGVTPWLLSPDVMQDLLDKYGLHILR